MKCLPWAIARRKSRSVSSGMLTRPPSARQAINTPASSKSSRSAATAYSSPMPRTLPKTRSNAASSRSAASTEPPGKTYAPGMKLLFALRLAR